MDAPHGQRIRCTCKFWLWTAAGLLIELGAAWEATRFVEAFLFGAKPNDPPAISVSVAILAAAALAAGYAPAWRASRIEPMTALRHE